MASARNGLARVLESEGDYAGAEREFSQALDVANRTVGIECYVGAQILLNHSILEFDRGCYTDSEREARQALEALRKLGGEDTPYVASALVQLGEDRVFQGDVNSAIPMLREAVDTRRRHYLSAHPGVVAAEVRLAEALTAHGDWRESEKILRGAMDDIRSAAFKLAPWRVAEAESALGMCLAAQGQTAQARRLLESSQSALASAPHPVFRKLAAARLRQLR